MIFGRHTVTVTAALLVPLASASASDRPHAVALSHAFAVGDRFHLDGSSENTKRRHVSADGEKQPDLNLRSTIRFGYDVEVLTVADARPTKLRGTITKLLVDDGKEKRSLLEGTPTVIAYLDESGFTKIVPDQGMISDQALSALYQVIHLEQRRVFPEALVASSTPRSPKDEWVIAAPLAANYLGERELDVDPDSISATARFVGPADVGGIPCEAFEARLTSKKLRLEGVVPDGMKLTKATVEVRVGLFARAGTRKPILRETVDMTVTYTGRGSQSGVSFIAEHTAQIRKSWTRTELPRSNGQ